MLFCFAPFGIQTRGVAGVNFSCIWACEFQRVFYRVAMQLIFGLHLDKIFALKPEGSNAIQFQLAIDSITARFHSWALRISAPILSSCNSNAAFQQHFKFQLNFALHLTQKFSCISAVCLSASFSVNFFELQSELKCICITATFEPAQFS